MSEPQIFDMFEYNSAADPGPPESAGMAALAGQAVPHIDGRPSTIGGDHDHQDEPQRDVVQSAALTAPGKPRTVGEVLNAAQREIPTPNPRSDWAGMCLMFVRVCWGFPPVGLLDANAAWADCVQRNHDVRTGGYPPAGAPVYWRIGKHGHAALSAGRGMVYSTDILKTGYIALVSLGTIAARWGAQYRGWSRGYGPHVLPLKLANIGKVRAAAALDPGRPQGAGTAGATDSVRLVERALIAEGLLAAAWGADGSFGTKTIQAYANWQRKLGYRGADADGKPGLKSLIRLGNAHDFGVY